VTVADLPPPSPVTARGALRRSLVLWGWGQLATGDRRGIALAGLELAWLGAFAWAVPPLLDGALDTAVFVAVLSFVGVWGVVAVDAYRRAIRRRAAFDLPGPDGGATDLLWLAPVVIVGVTVLWSVGGTLARADATLARYLSDWRTGDTADASTIFVGTPNPDELSVAWSGQLARLRNEIVRLAAVGGNAAGLDPERPFESIRFTDAARSQDAAPEGGVRRVRVAIVRREAVRGSFLGLFPTSSQVLVPVTDLGWIELQARTRPAGRLGVPDSPVWLVASMDLLGERLAP
jgi:hypothetical protein